MIREWLGLLLRMVVDWKMREKAVDFWTLLLLLLKMTGVFFFLLVNLFCLFVLCINFIFFSEIA